MVKMNHIDEQRISKFLTKYCSPDITRKDVCRVLENYKSLHWKIEPFVFNDGSRKELINLQGTIPVVFKGNTYHIPICIWVMDTHPNNAPMCYVTPTPEMSIKVSNFVDHNGKIYLPYLHEWTPLKSDLGSLIQVMIIIFGDHPPVYAKPKTDPMLPHTFMNSTPYPKQPMMPMMPQGGFSQAPSQMMTNVYPPSDLPYPNFPYPSSTPNYPLMPGYTGPYPPYSPTPAVPANSNTGTGTISEEHIRASLLSAVGDKLKRRLREQFSQLQAELETLRRTQQELSSGSARLTELFTKFQKEKSELEKNIKILQDKESELEKEVEKLQDNQSIDVDEAVTTIAPLYKQMLNAFVEEAAIEDAIYYLAEGLRSSIIDLDAFLKQVRQLSRRQFMLRALMSLCRQKAGLAS